MLVFLFIVASASMALPVMNAASNCSTCELGNYFSDSNGYGCFEFANGAVACTCPDQTYKLNQPCRVCSRPNICGNDPTASCAESLPSLLGVQTNETQFYACFCSDMSFYVGGPCPSVPTTVPIALPTTPVALQ